MQAPISVPIHLQDDVTKCGPACAQMVVAALVNRIVGQAQIATHANQTLAGWATTPKALCAMINHELAQNHPPYAVHRGDFQAMMDYAMAATEAAPRSPVVALMFGGEHWAVVRGFTGSGKGLAIHYRDPKPPGNGPRRHSAGDDCAYDDAELSGRPTGEFAVCSLWAHDFYVNGTKAPEANHFVMVGPVVPSGSIRYSCTARPGPRIGGGVIERVRIALTQFTTFGILQLDDWHIVNFEAVETMAKFARQVDRLDGGEPYLLVPLFDTRLRPIGAMRVDAATGDLLSARLGLTTKQLTYLFSDTPLVPAPDAHRTFRLVWEPVEETFGSAYFPLVRFAEGAPRFYRSFDKSYFERTTPI